MSAGDGRGEAESGAHCLRRATVASRVQVVSSGIRGIDCGALAGYSDSHEGVLEEAGLGHCGLVGEIVTIAEEDFEVAHVVGGDHPGDVDDLPRTIRCLGG
jgi:hypothetical protein